MAVTQTETRTNGCCPKCDHPIPQDFFLNGVHGHLSDGLLFLTCPNCQAQIDVIVELQVTERVQGRPC